MSGIIEDLYSQKWYTNVPKALGHFFTEELRRGTLLKSLSTSLKEKKVHLTQEESFHGLLHTQAQKYPHRPFLYFEDQTISFQKASLYTKKMASFLQQHGVTAQSGVGIMMPNGPEFLYAFYATQQLGAYCVPLNTALVGDGLQYIVDHSQIDTLIVDQDFQSAINKIKKNIPQLKTILVANSPPSHKKDLHLEDFYQQTPLALKHSPPFNPEAKSTILYTSGTTGRPKGVVLKYGSQLLRRLGLMNAFIYNKNDILFTCLPLFHANALYISMSASLWMGIPIVLEKKFSASLFWKQINRRKVTVFNAIGAMIPILLKNPQGPHDSQNSVRLVLSSACPANSWEIFEKRFQLKIWECYSAVDGGQNYIFNMGNAPIGSIGKISRSTYRLVNEKGDDCAPREVGELWFKMKDKGPSFEYFKNKKATEEKIQEGYLKTGDLLYRDQKGFLYFVGRKTESMRRRGENVSAFEVEKALLEHPHILECAVYAVNSELGEDDIMAALVLVPGKILNPKDLPLWLKDKLAAFAIPRYIRLLEELPKTSTHRVIKKSLEQEGITTDSFDLENINEIS